jgi:hypothetical protein
MPRVSKTRPNLFHERKANETSTSSRRGEAFGCGRYESTLGSGAPFPAFHLWNRPALVWLREHAANLCML